MNIAWVPLCATCHTLTTEAFDADGNVVGSLPEQVPYQEWQHSAFVAEEVGCQSCHMPAVGTRRRSRRAKKNDPGWGSSRIRLALSHLPSRSPNAFTPQTPAGDAASTAPAQSATTPSPIGSGPPLVNPLSIDIVLAAHTTHARLQWHTYDHWAETPGAHPTISRHIPVYLGSFFLFAGTKAAARGR